MKLIFKANSEKECIDYLLNLHIHIKSRKEGRDQFSLELWVLKHYLLKILNEIKFPLKVYKSEKPDFIIEMNYSKLGIEITEATSEYYQKLLTRFSSKSNHTIETGKITYGKSYTNAELDSFIKSSNVPLSGYGTNGYKFEFDASCWIFDSAMKKIPKVIKWNKNFPVRIVIYDNTPTQNLMFNILTEYLIKNFSNDQFIKDYEIDILSSDGNRVLRSKYNFNEKS